VVENYVLASMVARPADDEALLEGERPDTPHLDDVRAWITIYAELLVFSERSLNRTRQAMDRMAPRVRAEMAATDERMMLRHIARLAQRLAFWRGRLSELGGIDFDPFSRRLAHAGHSVVLTRREAELFSYLLAHPNRFFGATQLVRQAWQAPDLSAEQLRSYIVRLRRHLQALQLPCDLVSEPHQGYAIVVAAN
jgi:DNA-binding response OmpR family regulator